MTAAGQQRLSGWPAIVAGADSRVDGIGNGRATAIVLARHGASVALVDSVRDWAEATAAMIETEGGQCLVIEADVADAAASAEVVRRTVERWGGLDILVNNVGIAGPAGTAVEAAPQ